MNVTYFKVVRDEEGELLERLDITGHYLEIKSRLGQLQQMLDHEQKRTEDLRELLDSTRKICLDQDRKLTGAYQSK